MRLGIGALIAVATAPAQAAPPADNTFIGASLEAGYLYGNGSKSVAAHGGGVMAGARAQFGLGSPPGPREWHGIVVHPTVGYYAARATGGATLTTLNAGANAGYQFFSLGYDGKSSVYSGWGVFGGYRAAFARTNLSADNETVTTNELSHGPVLSLLLPTYYDRPYFGPRDHLSMAYLTFVLLPGGDLSFFTISAGYQF